MFDKYRARFAKFEEDHESVRKAKKHVEKYQLGYAVGATAIVSIFGTKAFGKPTIVNNVIEQAAPIVAPVFNNHNVGNVVNTTVNNGGHLHKIVKRIKPDGTEELFETITDAAKELAPEYGIKATSAFDRISKVANGHLSDYKDDHFTFVGVGTR